jgi:hypothetical protein
MAPIFVERREPAFKLGFLRKRAAWGKPQKKSSEKGSGHMR